MIKQRILYRERGKRDSVLEMPQNSSWAECPLQDWHKARPRDTGISRFLAEDKFTAQWAYLSDVYPLCTTRAEELTVIAR